MHLIKTRICILLAILAMLCMPFQLTLAEDTALTRDMPWMTGIQAVTPTPDDPTPESIVQQATTLLGEIGYYQYHLDSITAEVYLVQHETLGEEPVWLALFYREGVLLHKIVLSREGHYLAMAPAYYSFDEFIASPGANTKPAYILANLIDLGFWDMTVEEKAAFSAKWNPIVDAYVHDYPGLMDDTRLMYKATRHVYGVPGAGDMTQEEATKIASKTLLRLGVSVDTFADREMRFTYDITDPEHPIWKVLIYHVSFDKLSDVRAATDTTSYQVFIDAATGQVIQIVDNTMDNFDGFNM